jgi:CRP/FNR family transcriptional activator FtrB
MTPDDLAEVRQLPLFAALPPSGFSELMQGAQALHVAAGEELIRQGGRAEFLHVVVEGRVELFAQWQGRSTTMAVVHPVGTFILAACVRDLPYLMSARALVPSRVLLVPAADLRAVLRRDPEFAMTILGELAGAFRYMARHAKNLKLRTARERVACYLLSQSQMVGGEERFVLQVEKRRVASYLGMTPEHLSRALKSLEKQGIEVQGQTVTITERDRLMAACPPDLLIDGPDPEPISGGVSLPAPSLP